MFSVKIIIIRFYSISNVKLKKFKKKGKFNLNKSNQERSRKKTFKFLYNLLSYFIRIFFYNMKKCYFTIQTL